MVKISRNGLQDQSGARVRIAGNSKLKPFAYINELLNKYSPIVTHSFDFIQKITKENLH